MNFDKLLKDEIVSEVTALKDIEMGTEAYKHSVEGITKLVDKAIEMEKINIEIKEKARDREFDQDLKLKQMEDERKDRLIRNYIAAAGIVIPSVITIWGTLKSFKFEETGTVTTIMGRGFINKLLPKK